MSSEIINSEIYTPGVRDPVDSIPLSDSNKNIKNRHNQLNTKFNAGVTLVAGADVLVAIPNHDDLGDKLDETGLKKNYVKEGGEGKERSTPAMSVKVSAIKAQVGGSHIKKGFCSWARSGTTITVTEKNHGRSTSNTIDVETSSAPTPVPLGEKTITVTDTNTYTFTGVASGVTSGTLECATILGPITAPTTNDRYDVLVINSDNTHAIVQGTESADTVLPAVASTQNP